jgi:2-aminoadipate transaminase
VQKKTMPISPDDLKSQLARNGPPLFFPEAPDPDAYNFDQGLAAPETFPESDLVRLARQVLADDRACLDYFTPSVGYEELTFGNRGLRSQIVARAARLQGREIAPEGVALTAGSVQAIALAIHAYVDRGDIIAVEAVSFPYALRYMTDAGADIRPVPIDVQGMDVDALEALIGDLARENKRLKMVYVVPTFHCPTGAEMSLDRRRKLVKLAQQHEFILLEDDVYSDLRFAGEPLPSLFSLDDSGFVIQAGSFSKAVAPGLRLGWMLGVPKAIAPIVVVRQDLGVSQWFSRVMEEFLKEGLLEPHLVRANAVYAVKSQAAVDGMRAAGDLVRFTPPQGSFYLWVEIDGRVDWERAQAEAAKAKIFFRPGERFMTARDHDRRFFRMAYSHAPLATVREGALRMGEIVRACSLTDATA